MRRSGSSSCMLRPKHSLSVEDLQRLATEAPTATVLTVNRLPPYCTDRLYMMSELQVHANSICFLCDINRSSISSVKDSQPSPPAFPPSIILYLLWKPNTYPTPRSFADGPLSECVRQCLLANRDDVPHEELEFVRSSPRSSPYSPRRRALMEQQLSFETKEQLKKKSDPLGVFRTEAKDGGDSGGDGNISFEWRNDSRESNVSGMENQQEQPKQQLTRIYVVVDRISPSENDASLNGVGELPNFPDLACSSSLDEMQTKNQGEDSTSEIQSVSGPSDSQITPQRDAQTKEEKEQEQMVQHNNEIKIAEKLARAVASSSFLRNRIEGISIGITSDARAAPGLEGCMDAAVRGAKERRSAVRNRSVRSMKKKQKGKMSTVEDYFYARDHNMQHFRRREQSLERLREVSPERSPVAIVAVQPDDLECVDHHDHSHDHSDHAEMNTKILQCRVSTEWNGKGECNTFVDRAMGDWRQAWCGVASGGVGDDGNNGNSINAGRRIRPKVPRISRGGREEMDEEEYDVHEPISTAMVVVFLAVMAAYVWNSYGDIILDSILSFIHW